ncbi:MAG TPA: hypothetical protein VKZ53_25430 [Candidatus Angelobacter sp.]|nr:hypothetical protein [Candidatus Angelobacter sp.]
MNRQAIDAISRALLYEGYMLYPYRLSAIKNRQRFNFGVLYPSGCVESYGDCELQTECLLQRGPHATLALEVRFLHLIHRSLKKTISSASKGLARNTVATKSDLPGFDPTWQEATEAMERKIAVSPVKLRDLLRKPVHQRFRFPSTTTSEPAADSCADAALVVRNQREIAGTIKVTATCIAAQTYKIRVNIRNALEFHIDGSQSRDQALMHSLVSTHIVLNAGAGAFVSLLDPPLNLQDAVAQCRNIGVFPVLTGKDGERDTMLASPIILYDYPQVAAESPGDLFDGTEIDEILSLRILTMTDEEKREARQTDELTRRMLERTEDLSEQLMKLHGTLRGMRPLKREERAQP